MPLFCLNNTSKSIGNCINPALFTLQTVSQNLHFARFCLFGVSLKLAKMWIEVFQNHNLKNCVYISFANWWMHCWQHPNWSGRQFEALSWLARGSHRKWRTVQRANGPFIYIHVCLACNLLWVHMCLVCYSLCIHRELPNTHSNFKMYRPHILKCLQDWSLVNVIHFVYIVDVYVPNTHSNFDGYYVSSTY